MFRLLFILLFSVTTHFAFAHNSLDEIRLQSNLVDGPISRGDSGVKYPEYATVEKEMTALATKYPMQATHVQYGKSIKGVALNLLRLEDKTRITSFTNAPAVEISGTIHGNEYLGIEDKLGAYFLDHRKELPGFSAFLAKGGVAYIIPIVNPDGFIARQRGNAQGADLNRDWDVLPLQQMKFAQLESRALAKYLDEDITSNGLALRLSMDYHCCVPALITPWTYTDAEVTVTDKPKFDLVKKLQAATLAYKAGNAIQTVGYNAVGSTVDYFYAKYGAIGLTVEGKYKGEESVFQKHVQMWDTIFAEIANGAL